MYAWLNLLLRPILRPVFRLIVGFLAIPVFRFVLRRILRLQDIDAELEKDLEQWFKGALVLLAATANMEAALFGWLNFKNDEILLGMRLLMALAVIECMPDQELFAIIHPGPRNLKLSWRYGYLRELRESWREIVRGLACKHLQRSSPVFAIMATILGGALIPQGIALSETDAAKYVHYREWMIGWVCYTLAIAQYLIIGLVTSRDRAMDVLSKFDQEVAQRRRELVDQLEQGENTPMEEGAPVARPNAAPAAPLGVAKEAGAGYVSK